MLFRPVRWPQFQHPRNPWLKHVERQPKNRRAKTGPDKQVKTDKIQQEETAITKTQQHASVETPAVKKCATSAEVATQPRIIKLPFSFLRAFCYHAL